MKTRKQKTVSIAAALALFAIFETLAIFALMPDMDGLALVNLVMPDGQRVSFNMESRAACEAFTREIAQHVESANCESF